MVRKSGVLVKHLQAKKKVSERFLCMYNNVCAFMYVYLANVCKRLFSRFWGTLILGKIIKNKEFL